MPHTPQGANGQWQWDGHTTARHRNVDGSEWLLKGAWRWVQEQKKVQGPHYDIEEAYEDLSDLIVYLDQMSDYLWDFYGRHNLKEMES